MIEDLLPDKPKPIKWKWPFFCYNFSKDVIWFRFYGSGGAFKRSFPLYSERNGLKKTINLPFGWRFIRIYKE